MTAAVTALGTARTVTMLFTDIEGSTVLLRRLGHIEHSAQRVVRLAARPVIDEGPAG